MQREQQRTHLLPQPLGRLDCWCSPGSNSSAHFIIKGWCASRLFPPIDVSYIRHKIMLTLYLTAPTLLVEQGFAGFLGGCPVQLREAPAAILHHAVPTQFRFRFAAIRWPDACRNALFAGARTVQRLPPYGTHVPVLSRKHRAAQRFRLRSQLPARRKSAWAIVGLPLGRPREARWRTFGRTGFRHGGLASPRRPASANGETGREQRIPPCFITL